MANRFFTAQKAERLGYDDLADLYYRALGGTVTPSTGADKTWTYTPPSVSASMTVPPRQALRSGLWLIWQAIRHPRTSVTFEIGEGIPAAYTFEATDHKAFRDG